MTDIVLLLKKYLKEELDEEEEQELEFWKSQSEANRQIFEKLTDDNYLLQAVSDSYKIDSDEIAQQKINVLIDASQVTTGVAKETLRRSIWLRLSVAAAILLLLAVSAVYVLRKKQQPGTDVAKASNEKPDIIPGNYKATLKLANGRSIELDSATIGQLAQQGGIQVLNKSGLLVYAPSNVEDKGEVIWNTLSTAKGQTYPLLLSDGSRAWLNSESSIRFPVSFKGDLREVQITGEVLFEVAHDPSKPFKVTARDINVQVLGTTFNVNAYNDEEAIKTTLIEGSVQVTKGIQRKKIKPGQQAQVLAHEIKVVENVDVDKIIAWKQGYFRFKEDKLSEAMKNIARWYNVEVVFVGNAGNVEFSGDINRSSNLSEVVKLLAAMDVDARIEGRKLILKTQ
jgi:ferric-dicitrate binding protein FerR (iron transport regulator)